MSSFKQIVLKYESLHGRQVGVRRFVNFLMGGLTPDKQSNQRKRKRDQPDHAYRSTF